MIEENGVIDHPNLTLKQRSLLTKYEIPIDHLTYEYIEVCKDVKELERIVRILRSGEEGYYPDLQNTAEERLRTLSPNNRHLRAEEPVLTRNSMNNEEWSNIVSDVASWKKEISVRDLRLTEENNNTMDELELPPVRQPPAVKCASEKKVVDCAATVKKCVSDYTAWDKYDADTELLKMDLEQEREKERQRERIQAETDRLDHIVKEAEKLSETERRVLADQEKDRGNEYYVAKEYTEAVKYYTASIAIWPTPKAYNNRAACYLKQCQYSAALADANSTLALESDNVKALFRRGIALQHKNMFREALSDMNAVLRHQPKNLLAQHVAKELREQILTLPRTVRIMTDETKDVLETNSKALTRDTLPSGNYYEVNEWGLPKVMCQCNGTPRFLQLAPRKIPTTIPTRSDLLSNYQTSKARIVELADEPETPKASTKLEIIEVEKPPVSEPIEEFFKPKKCNVVDKRTQKQSGHGDSLILTNGDLPMKLSNGDGLTSLPNGDNMDEDFELNCPLLDDSEAIVQPH